MPFDISIGGQYRPTICLAIGLLGLTMTLTGGCLDAIPDGTINPPGTGSLEGSVKNSCDNKPLANASITVGERSTSTDAQGSFKLSGLSAGRQTVRVALGGYEVEDQTVQIVADQATPVQLTLLPTLSKVPDSALLDVLFVVDNSGSMEQEQIALTKAFPEFIKTLAAAGPTIDLRVGVISSDLGAGNYALPSCEVSGGDRGKLQNSARQVGCVPPSDPWIAIQGSKNNVNGGTPEQAFSCIAQLGIQGCGFEQPLLALLRSLENNTNPGFLREQATLAVVIVSDEDDCSAKNTQLFDPSQQGLGDPLGPLTSFRCFEFGVTCDVDDRNQAGPRKDCKPADDLTWLVKVSEIITRLQAVKTRPGAIFFSVIGGPTAPVAVGKDGQNPVLKPSCQTSSGFAVPSIRLKAVADAFAPRSSFDSICASDYAPTMRSVAQKIVATALTDVCAQ